MYRRLAICLVGLTSAGIATAADSLREDLRSGDRARIVAAMDRVYNEKLDQLFPDVYEAFAASEDSYVRRKAAFTLIRRGAPQAIPLIREAIDDPKAEFGSRHLGSREMALQNVLLTKDDKLVFDAIGTAIDDEDIYYRKYGTAALAAHPPALRHFAHRLPMLAHDPHPVIRFTFLGKLTASDQTAEPVLPLVLEAVRSQDPTDCIAGASALARFQSWAAEHPEEAAGLVNHLIAKLDAEDLEQAGAGGSALVLLRKLEGVIEAAQAALANGSPRVRAFAGTVLQHTETPFDVRQLTPAITEGDEATQLRAVALLARQASLDAVPLLKRALASPFASVRKSAVFALRAVGWVADFKEIGTKPNGRPVSTLVLRTERTPEEQARFEAAQAALRAAESQPDLCRLASDALVRIGAVRIDPRELLIDYDDWQRRAEDRPVRRQNDVAGRPIEPGPAVKIGSQKQLFIDDFIVAGADGAQRSVHPFVKHADNPVFYAQAPWEENWVDNFMCSVLYDETTRAFKMWYRCGANHTLGGYAVSDDGIAWHRPNLGRVEYQGSRNNNLLGWRPELYRDAHQPGHNVVLQPNAEPSRRYLSFFDYSGQQRGFYVSYSPDGVGWSPPEHAQTVYGDVATLIPDPVRGGFLLFAKQARWVDGYRRSFGFSHLKDVKAYAPKIYPFTAQTDKEDALVGREAAKSFGVLAPGTLDPSDGGYYTNWHTQIYSVTPLVYEGLVLGFYDLWYLTGKKEGPLELHLKASRDLKSWFDVGYPRPMLPRGQMGQWDAGMVYGGSNILVVDDEIRLYYAGFNLGHYTGIPWGSRPDQVFGVGLATLRLDGFVSMSSGGRGSVTTKPLAFQGTELRINARAPHGSVRVEIQDESGDPLPRFAIADCDPFTGDALRQPVTWRGRSDVSALAGRTVRLRFELHRADLFAFRFAEQTSQLPGTCEKERQERTQTSAPLSAFDNDTAAGLWWVFGRKAMALLLGAACAAAPGACTAGQPGEPGAAKPALLRLKVDFAAPRGPGDPTPIPGTAKEGWWPWVVPDWDFYRSDLVWEDGKHRYPEGGPGIAGSGVHAAITCHYEGIMTLHVAGMRRYLAGGTQPEKEPIYEPLCNTWIAASDFPYNPSSDLLLALYGLPAGRYRLVSYHNSFNGRRFGDNPTAVEYFQTDRPEPPMPAITVYPVRTIHDDYFAPRADAQVKDKPYGDSEQKIIVTGKLGAGDVKQTREAKHVVIQQVKRDAELRPSVVEFTTDGSPLVVVYAGGCGKPDDLRPHRKGGYAVLNAFELIQLSGTAGPPAGAAGRSARQ